MLTTDNIENTLFNRDIVVYAYRTTTMQLMIRGFGFTDAKRMVRISGLLDAVERFGVLCYRDEDVKDCADFVEKAIHDMKRIQVDWTGIIFEGDTQCSIVVIPLKLLSGARPIRKRMIPR